MTPRRLPRRDGRRFVRIVTLAGVEILMAYGESHGAWDDADGYAEGSLARVVEGAAAVPRLPSVKSTPGFLCGMEFGSISAELRFFEHLGLNVAAIQIDVPLCPGDLLVFDNLAVAHGREGIRRPGELHQRVYGHRSVSPSAQRVLRDRFLAVFEERHPAPLRARGLNAGSALPAPSGVLDLLSGRYGILVPGLP